MRMTLPITIDWSRVDHVLLDMDGTILDLAFDNYIWRTAVPERYAAKHGMDLASAKRELEPKFMAVAHTLPWYDMDYWTEVTGVDLAALHIELAQRVSVLDGSIAFLDAVKASGRPIWLLTNAHPDSWKPKLAQAGIQHYFEHIFSSNDAQAAKEEPAFWAYVREAQRFDPKRSLFADDSLPVLNSARNYGIAQIVAMCAPDSTQDARIIDGYFNARRLKELLPIS
tara:strand:- start:5574 stop:6251 length:678 start_codon:yes stop_codon:yes gene_type:complete